MASCCLLWLVVVSHCGWLLIAVAGVFGYCGLFLLLSFCDKTKQYGSYIYLFVYLQYLLLCWAALSLCWTACSHSDLPDSHKLHK